MTEHLKEGGYLQIDQVTLSELINRPGFDELFVSPGADPEVFWDSWAYKANPIFRFNKKEGLFEPVTE